jgi:cysteine desulfurase / selenocysteine lyase
MNEVNSISELRIDSEQIRADFPILSRKINGKPLIYFDSGATAQKPQQVIDAVSTYYAQQNANIHRGVHTLSQEITIAYEKARGTVQKHLNAEHAHEIIFTKLAWLLILLGKNLFMPVMKSLSLKWIITPIYYHGSNSVKTGVPY